MASHGEANRKCLQTQRRARREQEAPATSRISAAGNGSFLDLTHASRLFSPLVLPGRSSELDFPSLFLDLLGAFSERPAAGRKQLSVGRSAPVTRLAPVRLGQHAERLPSLSRCGCGGTRGRNGHDGRAAFLFFHSWARGS